MIDDLSTNEPFNILNVFNNSNFLSDFPHFRRLVRKIFNLLIPLILSIFFNENFSASFYLKIKNLLIAQFSR